MGAPIQRISADDAAQLATDVGAVPMNVGALLTLRGSIDGESLTALLASRAEGVPRLRQRLLRTPFGCGRPIWVDDPASDARSHIDVLHCAGPQSLAEAAVAAVTRPFDRSRPMWRATILHGPVEGSASLVLAFHHVLADGLGGLAVLAELVDRPTPPSPVPPLRATPTARALFGEAMTSRLTTLRGLPGRVRIVSAGLAELGGDARAPRCSLNSPTGARRSLHSITVALDPVIRVARRNRATLNDVLLTVVAGALDALLRRRGEGVAALVVSVPVSARSQSAADSLGNHTGVMPVRVPLTLAGAERLRAVAECTAAQKSERRGASAALLTPAFRLLAAVGLFGPLINRQRSVNTFLTNMPGPTRTLSIGGAPVIRALPITIATGNVTIAFAALSYAGHLTISVMADPDAAPDAGMLPAALRAELETLV